LSFLGRRTQFVPRPRVFHLFFCVSEKPHCVREGFAIRVLVAKIHLFDPLDEVRDGLSPRMKLGHVGAWTGLAIPRSLRHHEAAGSKPI